MKAATQRRQERQEPMAFGEAIAQARRGRGLNGKDMAQRARISPQYLSDIERGRRSPGGERIIERLAEILDMDPDYLFFLTDRIPDAANLTRDRGPYSTPWSNCGGAWKKPGNPRKREPGRPPGGAVRRPAPNAKPREMRMTGAESVIIVTGIADRTESGFEAHCPELDLHDCGDNLEDALERLGNTLTVPVEKTFQAYRRTID